MSLNDWKPCFVRSRSPSLLSNVGQRPTLWEISSRWQRMSVWNRWRRTAFPLNGRPRVSRERAKSSSICTAGDMFGARCHRHLVSELGRAATMRTLTLDYRRAPEFPFPHALEDAVSGYGFLLDSGFKPRQIAVAGDSAGAGLAVALLVRLKERGMQQPACALLLSPWADMTATADSYSRNAKRDPVLNHEIMQFLAEQYLGRRPRERLLSRRRFSPISAASRLSRSSWGPRRPCWMTRSHLPARRDSPM